MQEVVDPVLKSWKFRKIKRRGVGRRPPVDLVQLYVRNFRGGSYFGIQFYAHGAFKPLETMRLSALLFSNKDQWGGHGGPGYYSAPLNFILKDAGVTGDFLQPGWYGWLIGDLLSQHRAGSKAEMLTLLENYGLPWMQQRAAPRRIFQRSDDSTQRSAMDTSHVRSRDLEPRVKLGMFFMQSEQRREADVLDMALRRIGQTLPDFRVEAFTASQAAEPLRLKKFSEKKWKDAMALSAAGELERLDVFGSGGEERITQGSAEFELLCSTRTKWEPWREESCHAKVRYICVEVKMLRESWRLADQIADNMKEVALFAARNIELLQAYVSLGDVAEWDAGYLQRYKKAEYQQAEMATDHIVAPAWFCIVHKQILWRIDTVDAVRRKFKAAFVQADGRKSGRLSIQLAPRITDVGASELQAFRDMVL
jgi:hypothetical protein